MVLPDSVTRLVEGDLLAVADKGAWGVLSAWLTL
jgi:hypothetical protein